MKSILNEIVSSNFRRQLVEANENSPATMIDFYEEENTII